MRTRRQIRKQAIATSQTLTLASHSQLAAVAAAAAAAAPSSKSMAVTAAALGGSGGAVAAGGRRRSIVGASAVMTPVEKLAVEEVIYENQRFFPHCGTCAALHARDWAR